MHGKMSPEDKDAVMNNFSKIGSDINILVATTVIEVNCHVHPSYPIFSSLICCPIKNHSCDFYRMITRENTLLTHYDVTYLCTFRLV